MLMINLSSVGPDRRYHWAAGVGGGRENRCEQPLYRPGVRDGPRSAACHRRPSKHPRGRTRLAPLPEARDRRHLPRPDGGRPDENLRRLSRPAPPGARPRQGRDPIRPERRHWRNRSARRLDELEMRARRSSLRRRQGRRRGRPARAQAKGARESFPPLHAGDDSVRRPEGRRDGPGPRHQRAGDGLVHGHLFDVPGRSPSPRS